jgi:amino acid adenylation domain-containing protein
MESHVSLLIDTLKSNGIDLQMADGHLELTYGYSEPSVHLIEQVRNRKAEIIAFLDQEFNDIAPSQTSEYQINVTEEQKGIWMVQATDKLNKAYYIPGALLFKGPFNSDLFKIALSNVVNRHESLRGKYIWAHTEVKQIIAEPTQFNLPYSHEDAAQGIATNELVKDYFEHTVLDINAGPLFNIRSVSLNEHETLLLFVIHHIAADNVSIHIFKNDLITFYTQLIKRAKPFLPQPANTFGQYAGSLYQYYTSATFEADRAYWNSQFAEEAVPVELAYKNARPAKKLFDGQTLKFEISKPIVARLKAIAEQQRTSLFAVLLANIQCLLYRYTNQNDLTLGVSVAGRGVNEQELIGLFAKLLPLRVKIADDDNFLEVLHQSQGMLLDGLEHQAFPFNLLVEDLELKRDLSRSPIFDIMVDYIVGNDQVSVADFEIKPVNFERNTSKFDLTFTFNDTGDSLLLFLEFNTHLFEAAWIQDLFSNYQLLIDQLLLQQHEKISNIKFLSPQTEALLLNDFAKGEQTPIITEPFQTLFNRVVSQNQNQIAVKCNDTCLSYNELNRDSNRLALYLKEQGVGKNSVVAIMMERSQSTIISIMAVIKAQAAFLPIDPNSPSAQIEYIINDSQSQFILTESNWLTQIPQDYSGHLFAMDIQLDGLADYNPGSIDCFNGDDLAYIIYTSGSTGNPKGVQVSKSNFMNYINWAKDFYFNDTQYTTVGWFTSFSFDLSITAIFTALLRGHTLQVFPEQALDVTFKQIAAHEGYSLLKITPSHVSYLSYLNLTEFKVENLVLGGEILTKTHVDAIRKLNPKTKIFDEYGPTETTVGCSVEQINETFTGTIGRPIANSSLYVLNNKLGLMPVNTYGEICVAGAGVAIGYRNLQAKTKENFIDNPFGPGKMYRTGDVGKWLPNGKLVYKGRKDNQVKVNGYRIDLQGIASSIESIEGVVQAVVLLKDEAADEKMIISFYTGNELGHDYLKQQLQNRLPDYMVPSSFNYLPQIPITKNGKINLAALRKFQQQGRRNNGEQEEQLSEVEQRLRSLFEDLLQVQNLSKDENLFDAGLNSLKAIKAQSMLDDSYPGKVEIHDIFSNPTIQKLSAILDSSAVIQIEESNMIDF